MPKITDIIKYEGDNSTFIWKHPSEDFNSLSQLVVHESQEAIFMMNGQALDLFGPGHYTLETQNIPELGRFLKRLTGDTSPFHCEVYFINKTEQMAIKWGTDSKVQFMEPTYQFPIQIGACGEMSLRAEDSRKLLVKLVGTEDELSQEKLTKYFRVVLMTKVKSYLAQVIRERAINIFEIDEHLNEMSQALLTMLKADFEEYGVALEKFYVTTIMKPDGENTYERFKSLHFRQYADVAEKVAQNEASGQFTNLGIGLGTMVGVGGTLGNMIGNSMNGAMNNMSFGENPVQNPGQPMMQASETVQAKTCAKCGNALVPGAKFCMECGEKVIVLPQGMVQCSNCGEVVTQGKFCPECGNKLV